MSLLTDIIAYWKFDEGSGTSAADATGNGNTGTLQNSATWGAGIINDAVSLAGGSSQEYVNVSAINQTLSAATMAGWIKSNGNAPQFTGLFFSRNSSGGLGFGITYGGGSSGPAVANQLGMLWISTEYQWNSGLIVPNGRWVFVAFVVNATSATVYMGDSGTLSNAANVQAHSALSWNGAITFGVDTFAPITRAFAGSMDEWGFWSRDLSSTEIAELYNSGAGLQYPFSGAATASLFRQNNLTGIGSGGPFFQNPLTRSMLGWREALSGLLIPDRKLVPA